MMKTELNSALKPLEAVAPPTCGIQAVVENLENALYSLEWDRLLEYAEQEVRSQPACELMRALMDPTHWADDVATCLVLQSETQEMSALLDREALWGALSDLEDPAEAIENLRRGRVVQVADLALLRRWLIAVETWLDFPREELSQAKLFKQSLASLADPRSALRIVGTVITPSGELSERASPRLAKLFSEVRTIKAEIAQRMDHLVKDFHSRGLLQENYSDVRDGRFVLPVKISLQSSVDGIIYDSSVSKQTVFIEPREVEVLNNRMRQRQNEIAQEIFEILTRVSAELAPFAGEIESAVSLLAHWDLAQGRARLGRRFGGRPLQVTAERKISLTRTAHPLLWWSLEAEKVVKNTIELKDPVRTLLITGPNTGGKTVFLKTVGLAALCGRTGFPFPGTDPLTIPFYDSFFVDVGDPQSIEQHLSSFSGHVLRLKQVLEQLTGRSLVLLDEMNSATDPQEGAALARAFLETVMAEGGAGVPDSGPMIVATTHDPFLKSLALQDSRILNASMEFNEGSLKPTYKLLLGVPGRSRALEIAEGLGLPERVLTLARSYLSEGHAQFERVIAKLETEAQDASRLRHEAQVVRDEAEKLKKEWTERTEKKVEEMLERTRQKLRHLLESAQGDVRTQVKKIEETRTHRDLDQARREVNETVNTALARAESALAEEAPDVAVALERAKPQQSEEELAQIAVGAWVRVPKWKSLGLVVEQKGEKLKVLLGAPGQANTSALSVNLSMSEVEAIRAAELKSLKRNALGAQASGVRTGTLGAAAALEGFAVPGEIDLRGKRLDDAMSELERFIDRAFRSGRAQVTIVHGLGTGAIKEGTKKLLKSLPYVKEFRDGGAGHGGTGATIVEF